MARQTRHRFSFMVAVVAFSRPLFTSSSSFCFSHHQITSLTTTKSSFISKIHHVGNGVSVTKPSLLVPSSGSFSSSLFLPWPQLSIFTHSSMPLSSLGMTQEQRFTQVISDVDDTLKSSGGIKIGEVALGGIDVQYERGEFYPGVFEFMLELSLHSLREGGADDIDDFSVTGESLVPAKVAILTARAEEFKLALELKDDSKLGIAFRRTGEKAGIQNWGLGPILYGSVAEWIVQDRKGLRKFTNFERLMEQDPSGTIMQYMYVGDTGEYDQEAGETMLREYPELVMAVFLHVVSETPHPPIPPPKLINGRPLLFFRTYVGAAAMATQLGLMDDVGLLRVIDAAKVSLSNVPRNDSKWIELERDISEAYRTVNIDRLP